MCRHILIFFLSLSLFLPSFLPFFLFAFIASIPWLDCTHRIYRTWLFFSRLSKSQQDLSSNDARKMLLKTSLFCLLEGLFSVAAVVIHKLDSWMEGGILVLLPVCFLYLVCRKGFRSATSHWSLKPQHDSGIQKFSVQSGEHKMAWRCWSHFSHLFKVGWEWALWSLKASLLLLHRLRQSLCGCLHNSLPCLRV